LSSLEVVEILKGGDGNIREAKIQLMCKDKVTNLRSLIQHLILFEADWHFCLMHEILFSLLVLRIVVGFPLIIMW